MTGYKAQTKSALIVKIVPAVIETDNNGATRLL